MSQIIALDIETPNRCNDRICSIALTVINDGLITNSIHYLVNPETEFDPFNIELHGIKPSDVIDAPIFPAIWKEVAELFSSSIIAAHNAVFDLGVLRRTLQYYGIRESMTQYICTLQMAKNHITDVENYKLPTLCSYTGISLQHHNAQSDSECCAELLNIMLSSGAILDNHIRTFDFSTENTVKQSYRSKTLSDQSLTLKALKDVVSAITCDNVLLEEEISFLQNWLIENRELEGQYPYDKIYDGISEALADGVLEQHELDSLLELFKQILDPVASLSNNCSSFDIKGKNIVLTGDFNRGDRHNIELELTSIGAICKSSVTKQTHYVVVGGQGSSMWCSGNYGTKVKKALEMQESGIPIQIIREIDFYTALGI